MVSNTDPGKPVTSLAARSHELSALLDAMLRLAPQTYEAIRDGNLPELEALVHEQESLVDRFHALIGLETHPVIRTSDGPLEMTPATSEQGELTPDLRTLAQRLAESNGRNAALVFACLKVMSAEAAHVERMTTAPPLYERYGPRQQPAAALGRQVNSEI